MCYAATQALNAYFLKQLDLINNMDQLLGDASVPVKLGWVWGFVVFFCFLGFFSRNLGTIFSFFSRPWVCECIVTFSRHGSIFMISLFMQHSYENIVMKIYENKCLSILAFLHYITLNNCVVINVYTLNLKWLVHISRDKEHEINIVEAQWLTYLLKCFLYIN